MKTPLLYLLPLLLLAAAGCTGDDAGPVEAGAPLPLVVEGWIDDEDKPVVMVTRAASLNGDADGDWSGPVDALVERWCRVRVTDVDDPSASELLMMHINDSYLPPVVYTSARLCGVAGHSYRLDVETSDGLRATAVTTIPPVARLDSVVAQPVEGSPDMRSLRAYAAVDTAKSRYYKLMVRGQGDNRYYSSFLGTFEAGEYDPSKGWTASRGIHNTESGRFSPNHRVGDTVNVKLCTLDEASYRFWKSYEAAVSLQSNAFFVSTAGCDGNVEGAKGYWAGYGTSIRRLIVR